MMMTTTTMPRDDNQSNMKFNKGISEFTASQFLLSSTELAIKLNKFDIMI